MFGIFLTNNLLISDINMSGDDESAMQCETNLSHVDIKPCGVDINQSSDSIMSAVNITLPLSAL